MTPCLRCGNLTTNRRKDRGAVLCDVCKGLSERERNAKESRRAYRDPSYRSYPVNGRTCYLCGELIRVGTGTRDHVVPLSRGGTNDWSNLRPAHRWCNSKKGSKEAQ